MNPETSCDQLSSSCDHCRFYASSISIAFYIYIFVTHRHSYTFLNDIMTFAHLHVLHHSPFFCWLISGTNLIITSDI
ncbi:hypothetical protein DERF_006332 [Dermatophagoides farinae]|uniref:Uncharacterized protein n=1 Tax=Dermatophagoides farinae TaxID=6954 RepID=A0A922I595_DERFA|nr:hypothetical protein DERF_006332 [Dermatophagoides farinae]